MKIFKVNKPFLKAFKGIFANSTVPPPTNQHDGLRITLEHLLSVPSISLNFDDYSAHLTNEQLKECIPKFEEGKSKTKLMIPMKQGFDVLFKKKLSSEMANWVYDHLLYWEYTEWDAEKTLLVLKQHFSEASNKKLESMEQEFDVNGKTLKIIADQLERNFDRQIICKDIKKLTSISDDVVMEIIEWVDIHLLVDSNAFKSPQFLQNLTIDSNKKLEYETLPLKENTASFKDYEMIKEQIAEYIAHNLYRKRHDMIEYGLHTSPIILGINLPNNYTQHLQDNVTYELKPTDNANDDWAILCSQQVQFSQSKLIDIRISIDSQFDELSQDPIRYFMAKLLYYYINYVRPIQWPRITPNMKEFEAIHIIMQDIEKYKITIMHVYQWMEYWELKYSQGRKIWFHFTIENSHVMEDHDHVLKFKFAIPLVFCYRGGNHAASCIVKHRGALGDLRNKEETFAYNPICYGDGLWTYF